MIKPVVMWKTSDGAMHVEEYIARDNARIEGLEPPTYVVMWEVKGQEDLFISEKLAIEFEEREEIRKSWLQN